MKLITKDDKELEAVGLDLTGKLASMTCAAASGVGYVYRKGNEVRINFKTADKVLAGTRAPHLANQDILLSEKLPTGEIVAHWDKIYID